MSFDLDIHLIAGRYEAAGAGDRDSAEWPPHPARVFCALVAGSRSPADQDALRWLECLPPPVVWASSHASPSVRRSYVVTNKIDRSGGSQFHRGRNSALRTRVSSLPTSPQVRLSWSDADGDAATIDVLDGMARRVPYLGRSTGVAALRCRASGADADPPAGLASFTPTVDGRGPHLLRVPYPGYLDELVRQHQSDRPAWEVSRTMTYRAGTVGLDAPTVPMGAAPSVYTDVIVLSFRGLRPDGQLAPLFTQALRRAVMSLTPDPLPSALHGHDAPGQPHVAFLSLPDVAHAHADGRLLGMAVAIPDLPADERRAIVRGVLRGSPETNGPEGAERILRLDVPRIGSVELTHRPGLVRPWGARPERWRQGSTRWVSVTPVVLDRFPRRGDIEGEIVRSCRSVGLPDPRQLFVSTAPVTAGGIRLRPRDMPSHLQGKLFRHVELIFADPVPGPLLLGAGRYLGIGLFAPTTPTEDTSA